MIVDCVSAATFFSFAHYTRVKWNTHRTVAEMIRADGDGRNDDPSQLENYQLGFFIARQMELFHLAARGRSLLITRVKSSSTHHPASLISGPGWETPWRSSWAAFQGCFGFTQWLGVVGARRWGQQSRLVPCSQQQLWRWAPRTPAPHPWPRLLPVSRRFFNQWLESHESQSEWHTDIHINYKNKKNPQTGGSSKSTLGCWFLPLQKPSLAARWIKPLSMTCEKKKQKWTKK